MKTPTKILAINAAKFDHKKSVIVPNLKLVIEDTFSDASIDLSEREAVHLIGACAEYLRQIQVYKEALLAEKAHARKPKKTKK